MDKKIREDGITCIFFAFLIVLAKMEVREKMSSRPSLLTTV
jgi:hypothetical protein